MAYATQNDLVPARLTQQELTELTNDAGGNEPVAAVVDGALKEASALVDSYSRQRYAVPLQASDQVKALTISIALYKLFLRRRRITEEVRREYDDAISFLRDVSAGKAGLDQPAAATAQKSSGGVVSTTQEEKFNDSNLDGFI